MIWTEELKADVFKHWCGAQLSARQIGALYGVSRSTILGLIHRMGLATNRGATAEVIAERAKALSAAARERMSRANDRNRQTNTHKKRSRVSVPAMPVPKPSDPPPGGFLCIPLVDRKPDQCAWVVGSPRDGLQCGHSVIPGKSWCFHHHSIVYESREQRAISAASIIQRPTVLSIARGVAV